MLRDAPEYVVKKLAVKNFDAKAIVDKVLELDAQRRSLQTESDFLLSQQKQKAGLIGGLMKEGKKAEAEEAKKEVAELKAKSSDLLAKADATEKELESQLVLLPNIPCDLVVPGKGAEDNQVVKMGGPGNQTPGERSSALGTRQEIRYHRFRPRCETHRRRLPCIQR